MLMIMDVSFGRSVLLLNCIIIIGFQLRGEHRLGVCRKFPSSPVGISETALVSLSMVSFLMIFTVILITRNGVSLIAQIPYEYVLPPTGYGPVDSIDWSLQNHRRPYKPSKKSQVEELDHVM